MSRPVHHLSEHEFEQRLESQLPKKRSLVAQKNFELYVIEQGWRLTDKYNYKGVSVPVALVCPNEHECNIRPDNFKNGRRCKKCSGKCPEQARLDFESLIVRSNWKLSSMYCYQTTKKKVNVICNKGHEISISPEKFKCGVRCSKCSSNNVENAIKDLDDRIKARGWRKSKTFRYVTSQTKADLICEHGHSVKITPSDFKQGKGCSICAGNSKDLARKLFENTVLATRWKFSEDYEYQNATAVVAIECPNGHFKTIAPNQFRVTQYCKACDINLPEVGKERFNFELDIKGWVLSPNESYKGANEIIALICDNGHLVKRAPADIYRGKGCPTCSRKDRIDKISESFVEIVHRRGWQLAPDYVYANSGEKVSLICDDGHLVKRTPADIYRGKGCPTCSRKDRIDKISESFVEIVHRRGWQLAPDYVYANSGEKVSLICDDGHNVRVLPDNFKAGFGCSICNGTNADTAKDELLTLIEREGWSLSDNFFYINSTTKVDVKCPDGHLCSITPKNFKKGRRCPTCATYGFDPAREAFFYIQQLSYETEIVAYKYGITCRTPEARMAQQSRVNNFAHSLLYSLNNANGQKVLDLENYIKSSNLPSCYLSKEVFPDGFTETIPPHSLDALMVMVNEYISSDAYILEKSVLR